MRICGTCKDPKEDDEFNWKRKALGTRQSECRGCKKKYQAKWYAENRETHIVACSKQREKNRKEKQIKVFEYLKNHPCVDCGESDPIVLEFDHKGDKITDVSRIGTWKAALREIKKCVVRCANCHRRKTAKEFGYYKFLTEA